MVTFPLPPENAFGHGEAGHTVMKWFLRTYTDIILSHSWTRFLAAPHSKGKVEIHFFGGGMFGTPMSDLGSDPDRIGTHSSDPASGVPRVGLPSLMHTSIQYKVATYVHMSCIPMHFSIETFPANSYCPKLQFRTVILLKPH